MTMILQTRWKLLVELKAEAFRSLPLLFNFDTARSFMRTLGGRSALTFCPQSLSCTVPFYQWLNRTCVRLGFTGRKFPLTQSSTNRRYNFSFRLYGTNLLVIEVERSPLVVGKDEDLITLTDFWKEPALGELTHHIIGLINNPGRDFKPAGQRPAAYPCNRLVAPQDEQPDQPKLVELLTRHRLPSQKVLKTVHDRNDTLQSDSSMLLVDRQGVLAFIPQELEDDLTVTRRFLAASNTLEILACVAKMIECHTLLSLPEEHLADLSFYLSNPQKRFLHSYSSRLIWQALAAEFYLDEDSWKQMDLHHEVEEVIERNAARVLVVTALPEEARPFIERLTDVEVKEHENAVLITQGIYRNAGKASDVYVFAAGVGNTHAALNTQYLIRTLNPDLVIFSGIAGGRKDAQIGDVVIANHVYHYESGKQTATGFEARPRVLQPSPAAHSLIGSFMMSAHSVHEDFKVYSKPIASGEKLIGSTKSDVAKLLVGTYGDALAIEMEGFGFFAALESTTIPAVLIRGISDLLDKKSKTENHDLAINHAADIAIKLIALHQTVKPA